MGIFGAVAAPRASAVPWQRPDFYYFAQDEELSVMLRNFCLSQGINVVVNPDVRGRVSGVFENVHPDEFINQISKAYGLIWFYDGNVLYIDPFDTITSSLVQVQYYDAVKLMQMLESLGIEGSNFALRSLDQQGLMLISGSPRFVSMTSDILQKLEFNEQTRQGRLEVGVYMLKHSWAYDFRVNHNDSSIKIPGLASTIANLMAGGKLPSAGDDTTRLSTAKPMTPMTRVGSDTPGNPNSFKTIISSAASKANSAGSDDSSMQSSGQGVTSSKMPGNKKEAPSDVVIQADPRMNAIIVRDVREKLPVYEALINKLDVPVDVISISAAIVDVDVNYSRQLGLASGQHGETSPSSFGFGTTTLGEGATNVTSGFNLNLAQPLVNGVPFLAKVQALEDKGNAKILSKPSVLTLDNVEVALENINTQFIQVAANQDAGLFEVKSQVALKVIPHVIYEKDGTRKIKMVIGIEDGTLRSGEGSGQGSTGVGSKTLRLSTQAVVAEGESILLGGHYIQNKNKKDSGIPFLNKIPIFGYAFKTENKSNTVSERMFLITAKVLTVSAEESKQYSKYFDNPDHNHGFGYHVEKNGKLLDPERMKD